MEGLRYLESTWRPVVGQRWHCKTPKSTITGEIMKIIGDRVLFGVKGLGERWLHVDVLRDNFFPLVVGNSTIF